MRFANTTDYVVILIYLALMMLVGLYVLRFNKGASEYFRGGSRVPWLAAGISSFMSGFSAWTFTAGAGVAYRFGIAAIGLYVGNAVSFLLGYFIFAKLWRRSRVTTVMEYLSARYGFFTHQTFSWATIVFQLFTSASVLYGLSLFVATACSFPVTATILIAGGIILFYCVLGGLWAVVVADFLQASILLPFCVVLGVASLVKVGGLASMWHHLPPEMKTIHWTGDFGLMYLSCWTIMVSFGYNTGAMAQRYFSVENERAAKKISLLCFGLFLLGGALWFLPPMAMRIVYPDLHVLYPAMANPSEASYVVASLTFLPHGLIGIMLASMFSSTMANLSANFNLKAAILSKDVYQKLFRPAASDRELLLIGGLMTVLVGGTTVVLAAIMAARGDSIFHSMLVFNTLISVSYGPPALLGLAFRRTPWWSGLASFATGLALGMLGDFVYHWTFVQQILYVVPPSFAVFFLSRSFDHKEWPERAELFLRLNTPVEPEEIEEAPDYSGPIFRFLSRTVGGIGLASLLLLFHTPASERGMVLAFSGITLAVAVSLAYLRPNTSDAV